MTTTTNPRVGEPRVYEGEKVPVLYPGEQAHVARYRRLDDRSVVVTAWMVEPIAGRLGWWLRFRYRWMPWTRRGTPMLSVQVKAGVEVSTVTYGPNQARRDT